MLCVGNVFRGPKQTSVQLGIDPASVAGARRELRKMARGNPVAEAAVEGFSDWESVRALERMWSVALEDESAKAGREESRPTATG